MSYLFIRCTRLWKQETNFVILSMHKLSLTGQFSYKTDVPQFHWPSIITFHQIKQKITILVHLNMGETGMAFFLQTIQIQLTVSQATQICLSIYYYYTSLLILTAMCDVFCNTRLFPFRYLMHTLLGFWSHTAICFPTNKNSCLWHAIYYCLCGN